MRSCSMQLKANSERNVTAWRVMALCTSLVLLSHILNPWLLVFLLYPLATGSILLCSDGL